MKTQRTRRTGDRGEPPAATADAGVDEASAQRAVPGGMDAAAALAFIEERGVVLQAGRGPRRSLVEAIAGAPIRGSWWGHADARRIFSVLGALRASPDVVTCRLIDGKVTWVHRRVWPALVRLIEHIEPHRLAAFVEDPLPSGRRRVVMRPFEQWVPPAAVQAAARLSEDDALEQLGVVLDVPLARQRGPRH